MKERISQSRGMPCGMPHDDLPGSFPPGNRSAFREPVSAENMRQIPVRRCRLREHQAGMNHSHGPYIVIALPVAGTCGAVNCFIKTYGMNRIKEKEDEVRS